jgi:signal transduction histidine kinase
MIKQPDSALYCFQECSKAALKTNDNFLMAAAYKNIGRIQIEKGLHQAGIASLKKSVTYFLSCQEDGQRSAANYAYTILAELYHRKKQFRESNYYGTLAWDLANRLNYTDQKVEIAQVLYQNYKALGNKDQAIFYLEKYVEASLKINQDLLNQQHLVAEARFNDEQQKNQIIRLNQEKEAETTKQNWLINSLLVAVLMITAIGLLYQTVNRQKRQIEGVNATLEEKVNERTAELQSALEEVKEALLNGQKIERRRVAADLHDNLGGMLSAIRLTIEALDNSQFTSHERAVYDNMLKMTQQAYNEVRLLAHNLQPAELEKFGLTEALRRLFAKLNGTQAIDFSLNFDLTERLHQNLEFNLYSICLELANNMMKHSGATKASFEFATRNGQLSLLASDNGKGFIPHNTSDGMGMRTIQERTEQMGGTLKIHSHPSEGTLFQFSLPLNRPVHASGQT